MSPALVDYAIKQVLDMRVARAIKVPRFKTCKKCGSKMYIRKSGTPNYCSNPNCCVVMKKAA